MKIIEQIKSVPFYCSHFGLDGNGVVRLEEQVLTIEYRYHWLLYLVSRKKFEKVSIPIDDIASVRVKNYSIFGSSLYFRMHSLERIPVGLLWRNGVVIKLNIAYRDRMICSELRDEFYSASEANSEC